MNPNNKCFICGRVLGIKHKSNYKAKEDSFAFASRKIPDYMHFDLYECPVCKVLVAQKIYEQSELNQQYKKADFDSSSEAQFASKTYINYLIKILPAFVPQKILDIGTGEGSFLLESLNKWKEAKVFGVEPSDAPIRAADITIRKNILNKPFNPKDFKEDEFDLISCFQTIEHIPDSLKLLDDIKSILRPNGYSYFVCHNYCSFVNRLLGLKSPIYDIEHLQIYSKKSIKLLFEKVGFKNIKVFTIKNRYPLNYWFRLLPIPIKMKTILEKLKITKKIMIGINVGNVGIIAQK